MKQLGKEYGSVSELIEELVNFKIDILCEMSQLKEASNKRKES